MTTENKGIDFSLVESWEGWDEHGVLDIMLYGVKLRPEVFGQEFVEKYKDQSLHLGLWLETSTLEVYSDQQDEPILTKKLKLTLVEE